MSPLRPLRQIVGKSRASKARDCPPPDHTCCPFFSQ